MSDTWYTLKYLTIRGRYAPFFPAQDQEQQTTSISNIIPVSLFSFNFYFHSFLYQPHKAVTMQMTQAAAVAILAFTSSAVAYYPSEDYYSLYAREAYAEPEPVEYYDDFQLTARDAELEWDIHPRDAYMEGFEAGLYAREAIVDQGPKPPGAQGPPPPTGQGPSPAVDKTTVQPQKQGQQTDPNAKLQNKMDAVNMDEARRMKENKNDRGEIKDQNAEIKALQAQIAKENQEIGANKAGIKQDDQKYQNYRQQQLQNDMNGPPRGTQGGLNTQNGVGGQGGQGGQGGAQGNRFNTMDRTQTPNAPAPNGPAPPSNNQGGPLPPPKVRRAYYYDDYYGW